MSLINDTVKGNDTRTLPTQKGPRGVSSENLDTEPSTVELSPPPPVDRDSSGIGELTVPGEEELLQRQVELDDSVSRVLGESAPLRTPSEGPNLEPLELSTYEVGDYSEQFTRKVQDQVSTLNSMRGHVPVYVGGTNIPLPDIELPRQNAFTPPPPNTQGGGDFIGPQLPEGYGQYGPFVEQERERLRQKGLDVNPVPNVLQQGASGIGGLLSLGRRAVTGLFKGADRAGESLIGQDDESQRRGFRAVKDLADVSVGGSLGVLLSKEARTEFVKGFQSSFNSLGAREQEAIRQLTPTNGAGNAGKHGPLSGDFGEYGSSWIGGLNYVFDGVGNQIRGNIAAQKEAGINLFKAPTQEQQDRYIELSRRNARDAWMGKDFSFLNEESSITVFDKDAPKSWRTPFKVAGGIALDTVTGGPDFGEALGALRRPAGKAADVLSEATRVAPTAPVTGGAIVRRQSSSITPTEAPGVLDRINIEARPYPTGLPPSPQGGDLARQGRSIGGPLARDIIELDPYPVPSRLPAIGLPGTPEQKLLKGTNPPKQLPPTRGVDVATLFQVPKDSPNLDGVRVVPDLSEVGVVDSNPTSFTFKASTTVDVEVEEIVDVLTESPSERVLLDYDPDTGRTQKVAEPDLESVVPDGADRLTADDVRTPSGVSESQEVVSNTSNVEAPTSIVTRPTDLFVEQVTAQLDEVVDDIDLPNKVLAHADKSGTLVPTTKGALITAQDLQQSIQRKLLDGEYKGNPDRLYDEVQELLETTPIRKVDSGSDRILTPQQVDELVPEVTVRQITPTPRANQAIYSLSKADLLDQAFDLKAIERTNIVRRTTGELEALARFMGHWTLAGSPSHGDLARLHKTHGLYAFNGPALDTVKLNRAVEQGVKRVQRVEPNPVLGVVGQSSIVRSTPKVMGDKFNKAVFDIQDIIGDSVSTSLVKNEPLSNTDYLSLVGKWVKSDGRSTTRRKLNTVLGKNGHTPTPEQVKALKETYGSLSKKKRVKLPKGLRDLITEDIPPRVQQLVDEAPTNLGDEILPTPTPAELKSRALPSELRGLRDQIVVEQVQLRQRATDLRQSIVELESDLSQVQRQQSELYEELLTQPELEPRPILDGTWEGGRTQERVQGAIGFLDGPVVRVRDYEGGYVTSNVPDWYHGSPYAGSVEDPTQYLPGSSLSVRGQVPSGFVVLTNEAKLAESLAKGRVPENTPISDLKVNPTVDKVYPSVRAVLDGSLPTHPDELEGLLTALVEAVEPTYRNPTIDLLRAAGMDDVPVGRVLNRLQDVWDDVNPGTTIDDVLFAELAIGYKKYIGSVSDGVLLELPGNRQVLLVPDQDKLGTNLIRNEFETVSPTDAVLYRTYADEVLGEPGTSLTKALSTNNKHQYAVEMAEELEQKINKQRNELDAVLDQESDLKARARELKDQEMLDNRTKREAVQTKRITSEYDQIDEKSSPKCL